MRDNLGKIKKILFLVLVLTLIITYFTRKNFKGVNEIDPAVLEEPIQTETKDKDMIGFSNDEYKYKVEPLFDYEINALIVHTLKYDAWYSISKHDSFFPIDLCMIWGSNVKNKIYQKKGLKFSQDMRWCFYSCPQNANLNPSEFSNNHLLANDSELTKKAKSLLSGDQVKIKGKLVKIDITNTENPSNISTMESSTERTDSGAGACEIILVENIEILKKGNSISRFLYSFSLYGLIGYVLFSVVYFFVKP